MSHSAKIMTEVCSHCSWSLVLDPFFSFLFTRNIDVCHAGIVNHSCNLGPYPFPYYAFIFLSLRVLSVILISQGIKICKDEQLADYVMPYLTANCDYTDKQWVKTCCFNTLLQQCVKGERGRPALH